MPLYRMLDGVKVELTPEQETVFLAQQAVDSAKPVLDQFDSLVKNNVLVDALIQELAPKVGMTETELKDSVKARLLTSGKITIIAEVIS